jgi:hypothetical protein
MSERKNSMKKSNNCVRHKLRKTSKARRKRINPASKYFKSQIIRQKMKNWLKRKCLKSKRGHCKKKSISLSTPWKILKRSSKSMNKTCKESSPKQSRSNKDKRLFVIR